MAAKHKSKKKSAARRGPASSAPSAPLSREPISLLALVLGATLFVVPLVLDLYSTDEYETLKLIFLRCFGALLIGAWALDAWRIGVPSLFKARMLPVPVLLGVVALATAASVEPWTSLTGEYGSYTGLQSQFFYLLVVAAAASLPRERDLRLVLLIALLGVLPSTGMALIEASGHEIGTFFGMSAEIPSHTTSGTFGNPNYFSGFTASILPLCALFVRSSRRWLQALALALGLASGVAVLLSGSRTGILAAVIFAVWLIAREGLRYRQVLKARADGASAALFRKILIASSGIVALVFVAGALLAGPQFSRVARSVAKPVKAIERDRLDLWQSGLRMLADRPLLGYGPDMYATQASRFYPPSVYKRLGRNVTARRAHNETINWLAATGLLGAAAWIWLWASALWRVWRRRREPEDLQRSGLAQDGWIDPLELRPHLAMALIFIIGFNQLHFLTLGQGPWQFALIGLLYGADRLRHGEPLAWRLGRAQMLPVVVVAALLFALLAADGKRWNAAERQLKKSYVASLRQQMASALKHADAAAELRPSERRYAEAQAQLRLRMAKSPAELDEARRSIGRALDICRSPLGLWIALSVEQRAGDVDAAAALADEVLGRDPTRPGELQQKVVWFINRGRPQLVKKLLAHGYRADPEATGALALRLAQLLLSKARQNSELHASYSALASDLIERAAGVPSQAAQAHKLIDAARALSESRP